MAKDGWKEIIEKESITPLSFILFESCMSDKNNPFQEGYP